MIFKKIKSRDGSGRYRYRRAAHLMAYVQQLAAEGGRQEAVYLRDRGFLDDSDTAAHAAELHGLIHSCPRAKNPMRHYVLSWRPGEQPTRAQVDQAVDVFLEEAGWTRHLVRYAQHEDTDCIHVHMLVCTIDPASEKVRDVPRGLDIEVGHRAVARIEALQGWRPTDGAVKRRERNSSRSTQGVRNGPANAYTDTRALSSAHRVADLRESYSRKFATTPAAKSIDRLRKLQSVGVVHRALGGAVVLPRDAPRELVNGGAKPADSVRRPSHGRTTENRQPVTPRPISPEVRARELATGVESATRRAQEVAETLATATSWDQVHAALVLRGLRYQLKGSGAVIRVDTKDEAPAFVKASDVSRAAARSAMEKRLGAYQAPSADIDRLAQSAPPERRPAPTSEAPPRGDAWFARKRLWSAYQREREAQQARRAAALQQINERHKHVLDGAWQLAKRQRQVLADFLFSAGVRGPARTALLDQQMGESRAAIEQLTKRQAEQRRALLSKPELQPLPRWSAVAAAHAKTISNQQLDNSLAQAFVQQLLATKKLDLGGAPTSVEIQQPGRAEDMNMDDLDKLLPEQNIPPGLVLAAMDERDKQDSAPEALRRLETVFRSMTDACLVAIDNELDRLQKGHAMRHQTQLAMLLMMWIQELVSRLFRRNQLAPPPKPAAVFLNEKDARTYAVAAEARKVIARVRLQRSENLRELDSAVATEAIRVSSAATSAATAAAPAAAGGVIDDEALANGKRALAAALLAEADALDARRVEPDRELARSIERMRG